MCAVRKVGDRACMQEAPIPALSLPEAYKTGLLPTPHTPLFSMSPLLLLAVLVLAAQAATKGRDSYTKIVTKCKQLHNVSEGEMEKIKNKETDFCFSYNSKCLFACILKESHILTDGKFSKDNALIMSDVLHKDNAEDAEKARDVVDFCEKQKLEEVEPAYYSPCEHAYSIMICWTKEAKNRDILSTDFFV